METVDALLKLADVPVVAADENGFITYVNAAFEREYRWSAGSLVGKQLTAIMPESTRDTHRIGFARFLSTERPSLLGKPLNLPVQCGDGAQRPAEHLIVADQREGRWRFAASLRPLPEGA